MNDPVNQLHTEYDRARTTLAARLDEAFDTPSPDRLCLYEFYQELTELLALKGEAMRLLDFSFALVLADVALTIAQCVKFGKHPTEDVLRVLDRYCSRTAGRTVYEN